MNFANLEKAQWERKKSANIPLAPAATSKARCGAINEALRRAAGAGKADQKSQAGYCDRTLKGAEEGEARAEEKTLRIIAAARRR